ASVTSVGGTRVVGSSPSYAPEDHAHDLAEGVVGRRHLGADVYKELIKGGGGIKVEPDTAAQTIKLSADVAAPAEDPALVSSVNGTKSVGRSERYAREDHAHDLYINGRSPNEVGKFVLTPGDNVTIKNGVGSNELVISAAGGGQTEATTGVYIFERVRPQELRMSTLIAHRLDHGVVAVILAEEELEGIQTPRALAEPPPNAVAKFGDITAFAADAPFLMATVDHTQRIIQISLRDRRQSQRPPETTIKLTDDNETTTPDPGSFRFPPGGEIDFTDPLSRFTSAASIAPTGVRDASGIIPPDIIINPDPDERTYLVRWWAIPAGEPRIDDGSPI
ncbi:MAG: hypothetical protein ABW208_15815, partial [Pyrinomonadaceae bacterium]